MAGRFLVWQEHYVSVVSEHNYCGHKLPSPFRLSEFVAQKVRRPLQACAASPNTKSPRSSTTVYGLPVDSKVNKGGIKTAPFYIESQMRV